MLSKITILGVNITNETEEKVLEYVFGKIKHKEKCVIVTPNPEFLVYATHHPEFKKILNQADVALPDGVGLTIAARMLGISLQSRITGVDFIESLCEASRKKPISMGFLGGRGSVAEKTVKRLEKKYPWIKAVWVGEEWNSIVKSREQRAERVMKIKDDTVRYNKIESGELRVENSREVNKKQFSTFNSQFSTHIDILFVAFGFPKQEEWISKHLPHISVTAAIGVGGAFDYLSGDIVRAPKVIRRIGLEWLFRLIRQPWRFKRQLALITFMKLIGKEMLQKKK